MDPAADDQPLELRIGGWLPPSGVDTVDAADDATQVLPRIPTQPRSRSARARAAAAPRSRVRLADDTIDIGTFVTGPEPVDQSRHRRPRRRMGLAAAATVSVAVGLPLVFGLVDGPGQPDPQLLPAPTTAPSGLGPLVLPEPAPSAGATSGPGSPSPTATPSQRQTSAAATDPRRTGQPLPTASPVRGLAAPDAAPTSPTVRPPQTVSVEAEGPSAVRSGAAGPRSVAGASGGVIIGNVGNNSGNTLRFDGLDVPVAGEYDLVVHYISGEPRSADIAVNGTFVRRVDFGVTGSGWETVGTATVRLPMAAGPNTVLFSNSGAWAPDFDRVVLNS